MFRRKPSVALIGMLAIASSGATARPVITEVAWMGTQANALDEWIEIHNPDDVPVDLSAYELRIGSEVRPLPSRMLAPGAFLVLEDSDVTTSLEGDAALTWPMSLANSGEGVLRLCPLGQVADTSACDVAHAGGGPWPAGDNAQKRTMVRVPPWVLGEPGTFRTWEGALSSVTDRLGDAIAGTPGEAALWPDAGVEDAGPGTGSPDSGASDSGSPDSGAPDTGDDDGGSADGGIVAGDGGGTPGDAGSAPPHVYGGLAITEIYFNPPTSTETGKEWVEVANLGALPVPLDGAILERLEGAVSPVVKRTTTLSGTGLVLAPGEHALLSQTPDLDVGLCIGSPLVVLGSGGMQLANSGTQWLRLTSQGFTNTVKYAGTGVPNVGEGVSLSLRDVALDNEDPGSFGAAQCEYAEGLAGSPGVPNDACEDAAFVPCPVLPDAGVATAEGGPSPLPPEDAGPNAAPTIEVHAPGAPVVGGDSVEISYTALDGDEGDALEVSLFYDLDAQGFDGVRIASGLPSGIARSYVWRTEGTPSGQYRIFAIARDLRGKTAGAYAPGSVSIGGGSAANVATLALTDPDGVNDFSPEGAIRIRWEVTLPADAEGSISLWYVRDPADAQATPVIAGIPADMGDDAIREYLWKPGDDVAPGTYAIRAVLDWTRGQARAHSAFINVSGVPGCQGVGMSTSAPLATLIALSGWAGRLRRRHRRRLR